MKLKCFRLASLDYKPTDWKIPQLLIIWFSGQTDFHFVLDIYMMMWYILITQLLKFREYTWIIHYVFPAMVMESFLLEYLDESNNSFNCKQNKGHHYVLPIIVRVRIINKAEKIKTSLLKLNIRKCLIAPQPSVAWLERVHSYIFHV